MNLSPREILIHLICRRESLATIEKSGGDHPETAEIQRQIAEVLVRSGEKAVDLIRSLAPDQICWVAEVFDDVSFELQSQEFVAGLELIAAEQPELSLSADVEFARAALTPLN